MAANTQFRITELRPDALRTNLKNFMRSQSELQDYDFDGSVMSVLLDILNYNTYYNSFYANMIGNESFIDSAMIRQSMVSRAKELGYIPRSATGAEAIVQLTVSPDDSPAFITVDPGKRWRTTIDGLEYTFETRDSTTILPVSGVYSANVTLVEGTSITDRHTVVTPGPEEKYRIENQNVDLTSLVVKVRDSSSSTNILTYTKATDITTITGTSRVFFVEENFDGLYEIYFGDGVLGKQLIAGNIVEVSYRICNGSDPNFAFAFTGVDAIDGYASYTTTAMTRAQGGQEKEDIESIRFNAPRNYDMQNRAVTSNDYKQFILNNHSDIQAISVWGGEENTTPVWGKVYIAVKPFGGFTVTEARKEAIKASLEEINVHSIDPVIVDPAFLYIAPHLKVYYDPELTILTAPAIRALVAQTVVDFENTNLSVFAKVFRGSQLTEKVDDTDTSILSNELSLTIQRRFVPTLNTSITYQLNFNHEIFHPYDGYLGSLASTAFTLPAFTETMFMDDDGMGNIRAYFNSGSSKVYVNNTLGTIDYETGIVKINNFSPSSFTGDEIKIGVVPANQNILPVRDQILLISDTKIDIYNSTTGGLISSGTAATVGSTELLNHDAIATGITI